MDSAPRGINELTMKLATISRKESIYQQTISTRNAKPISKHQTQSTKVNTNNINKRYQAQTSQGTLSTPPLPPISSPTH